MGFVSGELGRLFWINLHKPICGVIISVQTWSLDQNRYRSSLLGFISSHGWGTQPIIKYTAASSCIGQEKPTLPVNYLELLGTLDYSVTPDTIYLMFNTLILSLLTLEDLQQRTKITTLWQEEFHFTCSHNYSTISHPRCVNISQA